MRYRRLAALCATALLLANVACGGSGSRNNKGGPSPSPLAPTATLEASASPGTNPLLDDVIGLAVQLNAMTREQATCVFGQEGILQDFLETSGLNKSTPVDQAKIKQEFADVLAKYAVQVDRCFNGASG
jgi:hypothetical protein